MYSHNTYCSEKCEKEDEAHKGIERYKDDYGNLTKSGINFLTKDISNEFIKLMEAERIMRKQNDKTLQCVQEIKDFAKNNPNEAVNVTKIVNNLGYEYRNETKFAKIAKEQLISEGHNIIPCGRSWCVSQNKDTLNEESKTNISKRTQTKSQEGKQIKFYQDRKKVSNHVPVTLSDNSENILTLKDVEISSIDDVITLLSAFSNCIKDNKIIFSISIKSNGGK